MLLLPKNQRIEGARPVVKNFSLQSENSGKEILSESEVRNAHYSWLEKVCIEMNFSLNKLKKQSSIIG